MGFRLRFSQQNQSIDCWCFPVFPITEALKPARLSGGKEVPPEAGCERPKPCRVSASGATQQVRVGMDLGGLAGKEMLGKSGYESKLWYPEVRETNW
jgi:hypothetical protein